MALPAVFFSGPARVSALVSLLAAAAGADPFRGPALQPAGPSERGVLPLAPVDGLADALRAADGAVVEAFPLADGSVVTLRLERAEIMAGDAEVVVVGEDGERRGLMPVSTFWTGSVDGIPGSAAYLAVSGARIDGLILDDDHTWVVSSGPAGMNLPPVVYDLRTVSPELVSVTGGLCEALTVPGAVSAPAEEGEFDGRGRRCRIATLAVETDYETTQAFNGDSAAAADYLTRLVGAVSLIYTRDLNVRIQIPYMRLWQTAGDPWDQTEMGAQLGQFRDYWASNMRGVRRTLAHYLTTRGLGGGVAWVGVHCNYDYGFGLSSGVGGGFPYPLVDHNDRNWPVMVLAHELGHNFGSGHTHDGYDPPIDGCGTGDCSHAWGGTIMSYCHTCAGGMRNIVLSFGPRVVDRIQQYLDESAAGCPLTGSVVVRVQPRDTAVRCGLPARLTSAASGPGVLRYRWERDGVPIEGGENGTLNLAEVTLEDAGVYTATAANACTGATSAPARLTVFCRADFNRDGFVDFFDYDDFIACFRGVSCPPNERSDFNGDGFTDFFDYADMVDAFTGPC